MNKYPEYIETNGKKYKINTDFHLALKCDEIARDPSIGDYEKSLAVIYILLGEPGLEDYDNRDAIIKLLSRYLLCGKTIDGTTDKEPSMSFNQDEGYIKASFMSDYKIDLDNTYLHWWQFNDLLRGLTENCILNRVRMIREESLEGKKGKEREQWVQMKKAVELKREKTAREQQLDKYWEEKLKGVK